MTSRLRLARDNRGWSQARLISELQKCARAADVAVMAPVSLRTALSRWENGHVMPDQHYRRLFRAVYGLTDDQLGFAATVTHSEQRVIETDQELRLHIANATHVDTAVVHLLQAQTDNLRRLDRRLGAPVLLDQMRAHIATLRQLLEHAVLDSARRPIASALADAAALAGWQALDTGSMTQAWNHYEVARNAALTASDAAALAHAKAEQAYVLLDLDQPIQAFQLVREARVEAGHKVAPRLVSWLWAAEAETAAAAGDHRGCRQALDHAQATLPAGAARDPELPYLSLDEHHLTRWRGSALARLGDQEAVDQLSAALECVDSEFTRARGSLHIDLAQALVLAGGRDAADEHVQFARRLAGQTGSVRQQRRLAALAA